MDNSSSKSKKVNASQMEDDLSDEISTIKGTLYSISGSVINILFGFILSIILARSLGAKKYGIWSLGLLIVNFTSTISMLGLPQGLTKFISEYRGNNDIHLAKQIIKSSILLVLLVSLTISIIIFILSEFISDVFVMEELEFLLKIIIWIVIPLSITKLISSIFKGYESILPAQIISNYSNKPIFLIIILIVIYLGIDLERVAIGYLFVYFLITIIAFILLAEKIQENGKHDLSFNNNLYSSNLLPLLIFSFPLVISSFLDFIKTQIDTFMLGYISGAEDVGIYNIAFNVSQLSTFVYTSVVGIFMPVMSKNIAQMNLTKIRDLYRRVTKWSVVPTLVIVLAIFSFSGTFLRLFGPDYEVAIGALRILLAIQLIHCIVGPNGAANIAMGSSGFVLFYTVVGTLINILMNMLLIPRIGVMGAAIASFSSVLTMNIIASAKLFFINSISPFTMSYLIFILFTVVLGLILGGIINMIIFNGWIGLLVYLIIFVTFEIFLLYKLNLLDEIDNKLLQNIGFRIIEIYREIFGNSEKV